MAWFRISSPCKTHLCYARPMYPAEKHPKLRSQYKCTELTTWCQHVLHHTSKLVQHSSSSVGERFEQTKARRNLPSGSSQFSAATTKTEISTARTTEVTRLCPIAPRYGQLNEDKTNHPEKTIAQYTHIAFFVWSTYPPRVRKAAHSTASVKVNNTEEFHSHGAASLPSRGGMTERSPSGQQATKAMNS